MRCELTTGRIGPNSALAKLLKECLPLPPRERAYALEDSKDLEEAHAAAALQGDSAPPASAEDEVDFHYICFVRSSKDGFIYQLDGDRKGPVNTGVELSGTGDDDLLSEPVRNMIKTFIAREKGENLNFGLLALVPVGV